jgi:AbrB family looped-hinge helix DNA binding protein
MMSNMTVLATTKIGQNFRMTLPQEVRDLLSLSEDDEIVFFSVEGEEGRVCFRKQR